MNKQICFPGMKPDPPTIRTRHVAEAIAQRIIVEVNLDDFYWEADEIPDRIADVAEEIVRCGRPATVFSRLWKRQAHVNDRGEKGAHPYGWEGIDKHCRHIADKIADEELEKALAKYKRDYK